MHNGLTIKMICMLMALLGAGCASGSATGPSSERQEAQAASRGADLSQPSDRPEVLAQYALWEGVRCRQPEEAEQKLTVLLAQRPEDPLALALRGLARSELGKREPAFEDMTEAVRGRPTATMYAWRGLVLWRNGNARGAERDAAYALRKEPDSALARMVLGLALKEQGHEAEACAAVAEACKAGQCFGLEHMRTLCTGK